MLMQMMNDLQLGLVMLKLMELLRYKIKLFFGYFFNLKTFFFQIFSLP
jgi:hypothetical protein